MEKKNFSAKEFTTIVKGANVELNDTLKSIFVGCNILNKAAKGDFAKVQNCENLGRDNIAKVAKVCKGMHGGRYSFDVCLFEKDSFGRFCTFAPFKGEKGDLKGDYYDFNNISVLVYTDGKGREIVENTKGELVICTPVSLTIKGVFNAFAKVAKVDIIATEKAAKDSEKAAKKAEKEYENAKKCIIKDYNNGLFGESDLAEKLCALKAKYNK